MKSKSTPSESRINGLDLFSGIAGNTLALRSYVRTVAYCESDRHAQSVLLSRMSAGDIDSAPICDDVTQLSGSELKGFVDIIIGGFPCQDISLAGIGVGISGKRSGLFAEIVRLAKEIQPTFLFLENVPAIRTRGLDTVIEELTRIGYDLRWCLLSAAQVGAYHKRERWFLLANANHGNRIKLRDLPVSHEDEERSEVEIKKTADQLSDASSYSSVLAYANRIKVRHEQQWQSWRFPNGVCNEGEAKFGNDGEARGWATEPNLGRGFNEFSIRLDGTERSGNEPSSIEPEKSEAIETGATEILQWVQKDHVSQALWQAVRGLECFSAKEFLLSVVCEYERGGRLFGKFLESEATPENVLRSMRENRIATCASHRRESAEQYFGEYPDAMRQLSQLVASRGESPWPTSIWEMSLERTVNTMPNRVDRIKRLGNAVVPIQAKTAFEYLMGLGR